MPVTDLKALREQLMAHAIRLRDELEAKEAELRQVEQAANAIPVDGISAQATKRGRKGYVPQILGLLEKRERPITIAEAAKELRVDRKALERAVWMELHRKDNPRLKRVAQGLYWLSGRAVPRRTKGEAA